MATKDNLIVKGDLIKLAEDGLFDVIVHGCNCFNVMGSGIAKTIKDRYPGAYKMDCGTIKGDSSKLGTYTVYNTEKFTIINAYTQYNIRKNSDVFDYDAFQKILDQLDQTYSNDIKIGFPLIGCGLAGGNKERILSMINDFAKNRKVTVVEFLQ